MSFIQHLLTEIIGNFFVNMHKKFGWGGIILVFLAVEIIVMVIVTDGKLYQYMAQKSSYLTVEDVQILSSEEVDGQLIYHVKIVVGNYSDDEKPHFLSAKPADTDDYVYIDVEKTGYYSSGEMRTYKGVPEEEYQAQLEADAGEYVGLITCNSSIPPRTVTTLNYDISFDAYDKDDIHEIYIYDFQGQLPDQGYRLRLDE